MKGILHAIDAETGKDALDLRQRRGDPAYRPSVADGRVFFGNILGKIMAVNIADGRVIWSTGQSAGRLEFARWFTMAS